MKTVLRAALLLAVLGDQRAAMVGAGAAPPTSSGQADVGGAGQSPGEVEPLHRSLDQILDIYVRDGFVYYRALQIERQRLDSYVASLDVPATAYERWSRDQRAAFWVNAYNAFVLRTVIDHYPIRGKAAEYPTNSIRQIPGAFDRRTLKAAGRTLTLDAIEKEVLPEIRDPRLYFALGRGATGSGRLRSEAYSAGRLESQLSQVAAEIATESRFIRIDQVANRVTVTPIFGWHEPEFAAGYAGAAAPRYASRSPIERAILGLVEPHLLPGELAFLRKNEFAVSYHAFDWQLNDLTGGRR